MKLGSVIIVLVLIIVPLLIAIFWPSEPAADLPVLKIISPHSDNIRTEFERAFRTWYAGRTGRETRVQWIDQGGTSEAVRYIRSEFARQPKGIGIDLMWGGGVEPYLELADDGLLQACPLPQAQLHDVLRKVAGIPVYDPQFRWYGTALSGFGIIYNADRAKRLGVPLPTTWTDLADAKYAGEVEGADPRQSGSAHAAYESILQAYGWQRGWRVLLGFAGNAKRFTRSAGDVPRDVDQGEAVAGPCIDFYAREQIAKTTPGKLGFVLPQGHTVVTPDAIAVLKGAPHADLAQQFVSFVLSPEGQCLWVLRKGAAGGPVNSDLGRMPVAPSVLDADTQRLIVTTDPRTIGSDFAYDPKKASVRRAALQYLIATQMIDTHENLSRAWRLVIAAGQPRAALEELWRLPVSEDELTALARDKWSNEVFRNETITQWNKFAEDKYKKIAAEMAAAMKR